MNRSAALANIGYVMGTGRANRNTEEAVFRLMGVEDDLQEFVRKLKQAPDSKLQEIIDQIERSQPGALPAAARSKALSGLSGRARAMEENIRKLTGRDIWKMTESEFFAVKDPANSRWMIGYDDGQVYQEVVRRALVLRPDDVPDAVLNQFRGLPDFQAEIEHRKRKSFRIPSMKRSPFRDRKGL